MHIRINQSVDSRRKRGYFIDKIRDSILSLQEERIFENIRLYESSKTPVIEIDAGVKEILIKGKPVDEVFKVTEEEFGQLYGLLNILSWKGYNSMDVKDSLAGNDVFLRCLLLLYFGHADKVPDFIKNNRIMSDILCYMQNKLCPNI